MGTALTDDIRAAVRAQLVAKPEPERDEKRKHRQIIGGGPKRIGCGAGVWPYRSDSMGCAPEQAEETERALRAHGCTAEVDRTTGEVIFTSQSQYRQAAKAFGMWDGRDGFGVVKTGREAPRAAREQRVRAIEQALEGL